MPHSRAKSKSTLFVSGTTLCLPEEIVRITYTLHRGKAKGGVDTATSQVDDMASSKRAKTDHPEAPKPVIGMQDERGRKGY